MKDSAVNSNKTFLSEGVSILLEASRKIEAVATDDMFQIYEIIHETSNRIAPVDSFFVALYSEDEETLLFPYSYDGSLIMEPVKLPIGNGPVSHVVRTGKALILEDWRTGLGKDLSTQFGEKSRSSLSGVFVPLRIRSNREQQRVIGVVSMQSYREGVYDGATIQMFQWLVDLLGNLLERARVERAREAAKVRERVEGAGTAQKRYKRHIKSELSNEITLILRDIEHKATAIRGIAQPYGETLTKAIDDLVQSCFSGQAQVGRFVIEELSHEPCKARSPIKSLTPTELVVLDLLASGIPNAKIADEMCVSVETVKTHLKNIYSKLDVPNRIQAVNFYREMAIASE